ncbi:MAG: oxaloacetate decarboxylase [Cyanobacteria bacterium SIG26]|nr:oxaloacetate decarboxylase [Cyanobacteria bacterium SIG26]
MNEQLANGLILLAMGMGFVLCFLVILIFAMLILKNVVAYLNKLFPEAVEEVKTVAKKAAANVDEAIAVALAAIAAKRGN